ncbi:F-box protein [Melia azedarach]|uniref:F-box protein n=1 Tax=Melia azedarach TaxID=155640 RepID=A0ACC1WYT2_MELAZ|nr:F-box protein [Melia azedarach]
MDRKSNRIRVGNQDKEDRISSLPDSVLCHILSFLPTKYAVATSILSSRWNLVWSSLPSLCFDDRLCLEYKRTNRLTNDASTRFENFVNRVLVVSQQLNIDKFSLNCFKIRYPACLKLWVSAAIMRNVREIELNLKHQNRVELPESIYTCKTLEVLKLDSDFTIKIPPSGTCFPSLKIFRVVMYYPDNDLTERLFSMCPVLEDLSIEGFLDDDDLAINFNISSSTLKRLEVTLTKDGTRSYNEHKVIIRAPNLEQLYIGDFVFVSYMVHELHSLSKAFIDVFYMGEGEILADRVLQLLKDITKAQFLSLLTGTISF